MTGTPPAWPRRRWLLLPALVLLGALPYAGTFDVPFVFDDLPHVVENPLVRDVSLLFAPERAAAAGASPVQLASCRTRWPAMLTFAVNYRLHGLELAGYHAVNLAIHLLAGLLLFRLVHRTLALPRFDRSALRGRERWVAFFSAALFLVHPLQTQAVTYVVQRMTSLAAMLCLAALVAWLEARTAARPLRRWTFYLLSLAALAAAMLTKQNAATFPLVLLLYELLFLAGPWRRRLLTLAPHLATIAIVPATLLGSGASAGGLLGAADAAARAGSALSRFAYLCTQFRVVVTYLRLLVWPAGQSLDHDDPVARSFWEPRVAISFLVLAALALGAVVLIRRSRRSADPAWGWVGFGVLWYFLALAVESSIVPIADVLVEHRLYLPSAGLLAAMVAAFHLLVPARRSRALAAALALATLALAAATVARNRVWASPVSLWANAAAGNPANARAWNSLGTARDHAGDLAGAEAAWRRAYELDPRTPQLLVNLGTLAQRRGDLATAEALLTRATEVTPDSHGAHYYLGTLLAAGGRLAAGERELRLALALQGSHSETLNNLANVVRLRGDLAQAADLYRRAVAADPANRLAVLNLAATEARRGRLPEAVAA
ncbi:MAG: tetratricopeptide repeat protein, partial [Thermoanaerobaculia bacterium]